MDWPTLEEWRHYDERTCAIALKALTLQAPPWDQKLLDDWELIDALLTELAPLLLPCPFCGGGARLSCCGDTWYASCPGCGIAQAASESTQAAVAQWNTRHIPSSLAGI